MGLDFQQNKNNCSKLGKRGVVINCLFNNEKSDHYMGVELNFLKILVAFHFVCLNIER